MSASATGETARTRRTLTIPPGTPVTIQLTRGSVSITGWSRIETEVEIVRHAPSITQLDTIRAVVEQDSGRVMIAAVSDERRDDRTLHSEVVVRTPDSTRFESVNVHDGPITLAGLRGEIRARTENGDVNASGMSGVLRLETTLGDVKVEGATLTPAGLLRLRAFHGNVHLRLAGAPVNARILATTFNGTISSDIPLRHKDTFGVRFAETTLGKGEPLVSLDVVTGNIRISTR